MLALLLFVQAQAGDVVVTGKRLEAVQAACVRGECTPLRDAQASIAVAEGQFRAGRYFDAKRTLADAVARNRRHAATDPKPVAVLYEAYATVALHEGDQDAYQRAVAGQVRTLRDNLPASDPAVVAASEALGTMWIKLGNYTQAEAAYRSVEQDALKAGEERSAMLAGMKRAWLAAALGQPARAMRLLGELEARPLARDPGYALALRVVRLRIAARDADDAQMTKLASEIGRGQATEPTLIWEPPYPTDPVAAANADARKYLMPDTIQAGSSDLDGVQWADIGYWIRPDGRTADAEILRSSRGNPWRGALVAQVEGRRYTAGDGGDAGVGVYRIERITKRAHYIVPKGSLIRRRAGGVDGFETLDLTQPSAAPAS